MLMEHLDFTLRYVFVKYSVFLLDNYFDLKCDLLWLTAFPTETLMTYN